MFSVACPWRGRRQRFTSFDSGCTWICGRGARTSVGRRPATPTGVRAADGARLAVCWVGVESRPGGRPRTVVTHGPALCRPVGKDGDALALTDSDDPVSASRGEIVRTAGGAGEIHSSHPAGTHRSYGGSFGSRLRLYQVPAASSSTTRTWLGPLSANCCRLRSRSTTRLSIVPQVQRVDRGIVRIAQPCGRKHACNLTVAGEAVARSLHAWPPHGHHTEPDRPELTASTEQKARSQPCKPKRPLPVDLRPTHCDA